MEAILVLFVQVSVIALATWLTLVAVCGIIRILGQLLQEPAAWVLVVVGLVAGCTYFAK